MIIPPTAISMLVKDVETGDDVSLSGLALFVCLFVCLFICLFVCMFVCLSITVACNIEECASDLFSPPTAEDRSLQDEDLSDMKG